MENITLTQVLDFIRKSSPDERRAIVADLNARLAYEQKLAGSVFNVGDQVHFTGKYGMTVKGVLVKKNAKSFHVRSTDNVMWKVSPQLVKKG